MRKPQTLGAFEFLKIGSDLFMLNFHVGQAVKAHCTFGREKNSNDQAMLRKGVITYIHPEDKHLEVNFGPYSECVFPNQVFEL